MSGLCVAVGSLAVQEVGTGMGRKEKPAPWVLPPEDFGHEHFGFGSLWFFLSLLNDPGYLGDYQKRLPALLLCSPS